MGITNGPKWDQGHDLRAGIKALELATEFKEQLGPRLPKDLLSRLEGDVKALSAAGDEGKVKVTELKGYTGSTQNACEQANRWASSIREALKRGNAPSDVLKAAGVGGKFYVNSVESMIASLSAVLAAQEKYGAAFAAGGVLPEDVEEGKRLLASLSATDMVQEAAKAKKLSGTSARYDLRKRIEQAVDHIRGAGMLHFYGQPAIANRFAALVPPQGPGGAAETAPPPDTVPPNPGGKS